MRRHPLFLIRWLGALSLVAILAACGGGGGDSDNAGTPSPTAANQVPITVAAGVGNNVNIPTVSVTLCAPGSSTCQVIDHVIVDTGSFGLRVIGSAASSVLNALPTLAANNGGMLAGCGQFVFDYTWGSVRSADVKIGGLTASLPIQIIGDLDTSRAPTSCTNGGNSANTVAELGANGILGVGPAPYECVNIGTCTNPLNTSGSIYYSCPANGAACQQTAVTTSQLVANPVPRFPNGYNDGISIAMNNPSGGQATGLLTFGNGGQAPAGTTVLTTTSSGDVQGNFLGRTITDAFFDTGSNGYFFDDPNTSTSLVVCTGNYSGFYCPSQPVSLSAALIGAAGEQATVSFTIANARALANGGGYALPNLGGTFGSQDVLDFGLPHFFGRTIYFGMDRRPLGISGAPYVAF